MNGYDITTILGVIPPTIKDFGFLVIVLSLVEISPIKINPWKWLKSFLELPTRLEKLEHEFNDDRAFRWRSLIFNRSRTIEKSFQKGELLRREEWEDTIDTISNYEKYCENNPQFKNELANQTIAYVKKQYQYALEYNMFL